jgi:hypothetical protein
MESAAPPLERERELAALGNALTQVQQGRGQIVLIEAVAGLGKTSLLGAACQTAAAAGFTCLRARASELERDFAYGCGRGAGEQPAGSASRCARPRWSKAARRRWTACARL